MSRYLYLHGFASGPGSSKARVFRERFAALGIDLPVPDLNLAAGPGGRFDFEGLTITRMLDAVRAARPRVLIGSSLGGYVSALYAAREPGVERIVLMAPAFDFGRRLAARIAAEDREGAVLRQGWFPVFHFGLGREARCGVGLVEDAQRYEAFPDARCPALVVHGLRDDSVPVALSREFAAGRASARLIELDDDHQLVASTEFIVREAQSLLGLAPIRF